MVTLLCPLHLEPEWSDEMLKLAGRSIWAVADAILCCKLRWKKYTWEMDAVDGRGLQPISKRYKLVSIKINGGAIPQKVPVVMAPPFDALQLG